MTGKKVFIVDDDQDILEALAIAFTSRGYIVETRSEWEETYDVVASFQPEVIILDILLSGQDGRVICRNLKTDPQTRHIPIIMVSAHSDAQGSAYAAGADWYLPKPFDISALQEAVMKFI